MAIIGLIAMLKQLMELMMMLMFGKCNGGTGGGANDSRAQSPEEFLTEVQKAARLGGKTLVTFVGKRKMCLVIQCEGC